MTITNTDNMEMRISTATNATTSTSTPELYYARIIACTVFAVIGIGMSAWVYLFNGPGGPIRTWGIFPGAPFVVLAGLSLITRIPLRVTLGAYIGGFVAIAIPYGAIWYSSLNYSGGGANIGLGLLLLATLVLLPLPMLIGGFLGWLACRHARTLA
jgi:hypothetical protein